MYIFYYYNEKKEQLTVYPGQGKRYKACIIQPVITLSLFPSLGAADIGPQNNKFLLLQAGNGTHWFGLIISLLKALPKCVGNV